MSVDARPKDHIAERLLGGETCPTRRLRRSLVFLAAIPGSSVLRRWPLSCVVPSGVWPKPGTRRSDRYRCGRRSVLQMTHQVQLFPRKHPSAGRCGQVGRCRWLPSLSSSTTNRQSHKSVLRRGSTGLPLPLGAVRRQLGRRIARRRCPHRGPGQGAPSGPWLCVLKVRQPSTSVHSPLPSRRGHRVALRQSFSTSRARRLCLWSQCPRGSVPCSDSSERLPGCAVPR